MFVAFHRFVDSVQLAVMLALFEIHVSLGSDVSVCDDVVDQFLIIVDDGMYSELNVLVQAQLWFVEVLTDVHHLP